MSHAFFDKEPAYLLHSRPYQDNSRIAEFLTLNYGRIAAFCRLSVDIPDKVLQPFTPMLITCGAGENLFALRMLEIQEKCCLCNARLMLLGLYLNELVTKLVPRDMRISDLFYLYAQALKDLPEDKGEDKGREKVLRVFELALLKAIGFEPQLKEEAATHQPVKADGLYCYKPGTGPISVNQGKNGGLPTCYGETLLAMRAGLAECSEETLREARTLMRTIISYHLGNKELHTRVIFEYLQQGLKQESKQESKQEPNRGVPLK